MLLYVISYPDLASLRTKAKLLHYSQVLKYSKDTP